jgi:alkylated DNA repair protein (DNA oxidative demethylase)
LNRISKRNVFSTCGAWFSQQFAEWVKLCLNAGAKHPSLTRMNPTTMPGRVGHQQDLFPLEGAPAGLLFEPEIMTSIEEAVFLDVIRTLPFGSFRMHGVDAKRRVVRFGVHYLAGSAEMKPASDFPLSLEPLRERAAAFVGVPAFALSESLVTEYPAGAAIGWHRDSPPFGIVAGISLNGQCRMRFQRGEGTHRQTWTLDLPPRSLYVMSGPAREEWQHSIPPVKEPRWSITFRTLKNAPAT